MIPEKIYADGFNLALNRVDAKIFFLSVDPVFAKDASASADVSVISKVTMSLPVAKQLCKRLNEAIAQYEKQYSEIVDLDRPDGNITSP